LGSTVFDTDIPKRIVTLFGSGFTDREQLKNKVLAMFPASEEDGRLLRLGVTAAGRRLPLRALQLEAVG